jgi:hypothetical protein
MAHVENHLGVEDLAARYRACEDVCSARHYQTIWLLAQGHSRLLLRAGVRVHCARLLAAPIYGHPFFLIRPRLK